MAKNSGITLLSVVITITATIILAAIFVSAGLEAIEQSKIARINNEIGEIRKAISVRYTLYCENSGETTLIGVPASTKWATPNECAEVAISSIDLVEYGDEEKVLKRNTIKSEFTRDFENFVKIVSSNEYEELGVSNITEGNEYIVNYYTGGVFGPVK